MRYTIISGRTVEKRDVYLETVRDPESGKRKPRGKNRGKTLPAQIERNRREAVKTLARILNCNFSGGDLLLTLKYDNSRLPENREAAERIFQNFIRRIKRAYLKETGKALRYVGVTADRSSKTGKPGRLHHHLVMDPAAWELIARNWPADQFSFRRLDDSGDYTAVALYLLRNVGQELNRRKWSTSAGMKKPIYTAPEPVNELGRFRVPKGAKVSEREIHENAEPCGDGFRSAYIRYTITEKKAAGTPQRRRSARPPGRCAASEALS